MSRSRTPKCNHSLNANRNYGIATRPRLHNRQGSRSIDCLLRDGSQANRRRACPRLRWQEWPRGASRPQGLRTGRPRILLAQAGRCRRQGCAYRLCRHERGRGESVLRGSSGGGRDRQRQARRAPILRSSLLRCERFRSRRLQSRGGLQELVTPPSIEHSQLSIWVLIEGIAALRTSKNAESAGLLADLRQATHRGIRPDFGVIGRMTTWVRFKLRTQRGISDTPSPLSTKVITVAMKLGSFTMRGEKPVRRQVAMTSSNRPGAPLRLNCTNGSEA